ncbi:D-beta-hydroxybutyrate dehydrogenase-like [Amphiura filiformis]|uniref:D-beta-hydroxybutyrate dehydrogenase-like n=1 Tax=Amphiura filiformis TaxID=82378 RepID=UPI003B22819C
MATAAAARVALVTGSTSGIGQGIARALASKGHSIILTGFGDTKGVELCEHNIKRDFQVPCYHIHADLANEYEIRKMCSEIIKKHPPGIDILVNNAGFQHIDEIDRFPVEIWNTMVAVMLTAPFLLTKYLLPGMRKKGWGRIINVASTHATVASEKKAGYCSAKHGLIGLTKVTALDMARTGITCNSINPGWVETEMFRKQVKILSEELEVSEDEAKLRVLEKHPTKELTTAEQVGAAVNFLCSPAADNMTGTSLVLDGGWTAL